EEGQPNLPALLQLDNCKRINITGSQFINGLVGIAASSTHHSLISSNTIHDERKKPIAQNGIQFDNTGEGNLAANNSIGPCKSEAIEGSIHPE
ncbi:MAG: hypothetical protein CMO98_14115, partial [Woeseia sp.]|nr:hypothetical protein [Woeseia sp.]